MAKKKENPDLPDLGDHKKLLDKKRAELQVRKEGRETLLKTLEAGYKQAIASNLSEEEEDVILSGDAVAISDMLEAKRQEMVDDKLADEDNEILLFEDAIEDAEDQLTRLEAEHTFRGENSELDIDGLQSFIEDDLTPKQKREFVELSGGDHAKFLGLVAEEYLEKNKKADDQTEKMPTDLSDVPGSGGDLDNGSNMNDEDDDFLTQMGMDK